MTAEPQTTIAERFSSPEASPIAWAEGRRRIEEAQIFWISTVRPDGRPHVTPLISIWLDEAAFFCTGADERKALNLAQNPGCVLTTGCNRLDQGLDIVIEGEARRVTETASLQRVAAAYEEKYGEEWHFGVGEGVFTHGDGGEAIVFEVSPKTVLGFDRDPYSQTRWRFV